MNSYCCSLKQKPERRANEEAEVTEAEEGGLVVVVVITERACAMHRLTDECCFNIPLSLSLGLYFIFSILSLQDNLAWVTATSRQDLSQKR
jgi:hypothetical protein